MWKKRKKPGGEAPPPAPKDATREALEFCFEDVSSLRMLGSQPLSDLTSGRAPAPATGAGRAPRRGGTRWNLLVLMLLLLTLGATAAATLFGR